MTQDEQTLLMFKGLVASLPPEQQRNVELCTAAIRQMMAEYPAGEGMLAVCLVGAELQQANGQVR